jgi:DNA-binding beta-propeller fold protein YncE
MADYYSSKVELLKYDLDTLQFEFIETGGLKYNGTLITGKFSIVNTSLYYIFGDSVILLDLLSDYEGPIAQIWPNTLIANFNVHSVSKQLVYSRYDGIGVLDLNTNQDTFFETDQHELDFVQIRDTAIDELNNRVFIGDSGLDMVLQFDLSSNVLEPYIMNGVGTGQRMITPREITVNNLHNTIYVLDDSDGVSGSIISVNLSTGERTEIIDIGKSEDILVDEEKQFLYVLSIHSISKIDLATLEQTIVSDNAQPNSGELFDQASGFALDTKNNRLLVTDRMRSSLFSVDIETGFRTIIAMEFGDNPPGESSAVDVEFDTEKDMAYVLSQSLGMIFSVDLMTNEKNEFLTSCPMSDGREGLNKEDWALQNLAIEQSNRQLYITTEDTILKIAIDTKDCQAPISGEPFFAFDVAVNDKGQVFGSYFNSLSQFDFESEQQVIISK